MRLHPLTVTNVSCEDFPAAAGLPTTPPKTLKEGYEPSFG
jgi:hypothetical protein